MEAVELATTKWTKEASPVERQAGIDLLMEFSDTWHQLRVGKYTTITMKIKGDSKPKRVRVRLVPIHLR